MTVRYRVSMPRPDDHHFEVEADFPATDAHLDLTLPVWTPGSYLVREYARHLTAISAVAPDGSGLTVERTDKCSFRVHGTGACGRVRVRYRVYANELTVRTSHLDATHGFFNGATVFLYSEGLRTSQHRVVVHAPDEWQPFCALDRDGVEFVAADYDELADSPFEVGPHTPSSFVVEGVPHEVVIHGDAALDRERLVEDLVRICGVQARLFGGLPMKRYLFIIHLSDRGRGGLEHRASTVLLYSRSGLSSPKGWEDFLTLAAHEYFHLWNVKRITPRAFVPMDYKQERYTRLLWAFEGLTSYYDNLLVRRAGLMSLQSYVTRLGESLSALHATPGRRALSLLDASFLAWIKHYRPDENTPNSAISYYLKGELVGLLLDLLIRRASSDQRSLDDVMRLLWARYGDGSGVPEEGVEQAAAEVAQIDLRPFFDRALRSTDELDYSPLLHVGLELQLRVRESVSDKGGTPARIKDNKPRGWLGVVTKGSQTIASVLVDSPAQRGGVYADDELVALDGYKADASALITRCDEKPPGAPVRLTVFRRDRLLDLHVTLGERPLDAAYLAPVDGASAEQRRAFEAWANAPLDELTTSR